MNVTPRSFKLKDLRCRLSVYTLSIIRKLRTLACYVLALKKLYSFAITTYTLLFTTTQDYPTAESYYVGCAQLGQVLEV